VHFIPADEKMHYVQPGVGHYGVFNGTRLGERKAKANGHLNGANGRHVVAGE
jgi:hypothetical protein